jgi:Haem-binding domain
MRAVKIVVGIVIVIIVLVTVIPLLLETNPPVVAEPKWDSPQTRELAVRSCFDCHSNETKYPWFARLPVSSLLVVSDTLQGRAHLNFSEWSSAGGSGEGRNAREIARQIQSGGMPPGNYLLLHPEASLTDAEKQQLIDGLTKSLNQ